MKITPACPGGFRPGLDGEIFAALQDLDTLIRDMRRDIKLANQVLDEETAVKRYLAYVSVLVDVMLTDMTALSAVHGNDTGVLLKQRILVEYGVKAKYFFDNPDYALYAMTIGEAESVLRKLREAGAQADAIRDAEVHVDTLRKRFAAVANLKPKSFREIMLAIAAPDDYVWLYGAPSAILHGDPEGIRWVFPMDDKGREHPRITLPDEQVNAMIVDAGRNVIIFCDVFLECFHAANTAFRDRLAKLDDRFKAFIVKHPYGRDEGSLIDIRKELEE